MMNAAQPISEPRRLEGKIVAILATDGFEQRELAEPKAALRAAGAKTFTVAPKPGTIRGFQQLEMAGSEVVDLTLDEVDASQFDALLVPGGVQSPDALRALPTAVAFVKAFAKAGKPVAAFGHGPWTLLEAGLVDGKTVTSWPSLKTDLINAGARWVDKDAVADAGVVTGRNIAAFIQKAIEEFA